MALPKKQRFITAEIAEGAEFKSVAIPARFFLCLCVLRALCGKTQGYRDFTEEFDCVHPTKEKYERDIYTITKVML